MVGAIVWGLAAAVLGPTLVLSSMPGAFDDSLAPALRAAAFVSGLLGAWAVLGRSWLCDTKLSRCAGVWILAGSAASVATAIVFDGVLVYRMQDSLLARLDSLERVGGLVAFAVFLVGIAVLAPVAVFWPFLATFPLIMLLRRLSCRTGQSRS